MKNNEKEDEKTTTLFDGKWHFGPMIHQIKAGYTATEVACGWAGAIFEVTRPFKQ